MKSTTINTILTGVSILLALHLSATVVLAFLIGALLTGALLEETGP